MKPFYLLLVAITLAAPLTRISGQEEVPRFLEPEEFLISCSSEVFAIIVDVREKKEYRRERIEGAINIPGMKQLVPFADTLDREIPIYIYCDTYTRSITAADYLVEQGFTRLYILKDGILEWKKAGLDVETNGKRRTTNGGNKPPRH